MMVTAHHRADRMAGSLRPFQTPGVNPLPSHGFGSQQLRLFRIARRDGASIEDAAAAAGISLGEAQIHARADAENPPPPEAFVLLGQQQKDMTMTRTARKAKDDDGGEIKAKDFAGAVRLYRNDIKTAASEASSQMQTVGEAYKAIKKNCHIQPQAAKLAFKLDDMEEARRDDFLRCFTGLLRELSIPLQSNDLVDQAEAQTPKPKPKLVTVPATPPPADDSDLLGDAGAEPAPGTGAAAIKAMRADHAKDKAEEDFDGPPPRNPPIED
jgi:hypothetical protein